MYCPKCGKLNEDKARFCGFCGSDLKPAAEETPYFSVPAEVESTDEQPNDLGFSIAGLILASFGITAIAGLIMSIIGRNKAVANAKGAIPRGKNKVAKILSTVGIPVAIVTLVSALITVIFFIAGRNMIWDLFKEVGNGNRWV